MMKCKYCDGTGKTTKWVVTNTLSEYEFTCKKCNGTGIVEPLTNNEWRKHCSAEEFAKFVETAMDYSAFCQTKDDFSPGECKKCGCPWCKNGFMEWLNEVHDEMPTCESCEYTQYCGATEIMRKCERHNKKVKQTNGEYMRQCDDASLAFEIWNLIKDGNTDSLYHIERWLKEKHEQPFCERPQDGKSPKNRREK